MLAQGGASASERSPGLRDKKTEVCKTDLKFEKKHEAATYLPLTAMSIEIDDE